MELTDSTSSVNRPSRGREVLMPRRNSTEVTATNDAQGAEPLHELMSPEVNVQRIMWTGTIWFVGVTGSIALGLGLLLSSGWRPAQLPGGLEVIWWIGSVLLALSVALIGWSGCPILEVNVKIADRNKTRTMQVGTLFYIVGGVVALFAILLGPAH
jgi:hypothetical protein